MKQLGLVLALVLCALPALAQDVEFTAPTCLRILKATATEATLQFEAHGGETFEAERLVSSTWKPFVSAAKTTGKTFSLIVPLTRSSMNNIRICAKLGEQRLCGTEGVYAKR